LPRQSKKKLSLCFLLAATTATVFARTAAATMAGRRAACCFFAGSFGGKGGKFPSYLSRRALRACRFFLAAAAKFFELMLAVITDKFIDRHILSFSIIFYRKHSRKPSPLWAGMNAIHLKTWCFKPAYAGLKH
jgi:hypothetical protein